MRIAPPVAPSGEACAPYRDWLDPVRARAMTARALPVFRDGRWTPLDVTPQRWDVRKDGRVDLTCTVRYRDAAGREDARPLLVRPARGEPRLRLSPDDPAFPDLPRQLEDVAATLGPGSLRVLAHRFGRRVTLRWTPDGAEGRRRGGAARRNGGAADGCILKVYARGEDERAAATLRALTSARLPFRTPELVAHRPEAGLVAQTIVPGVSAHDLLRGGSSVPAGALGRALLAMREAEPELPGLQPHGPADELAVVQRFVARAAAIDPELAEEMRAAAGSFAPELAGGPPAANGAASPDAPPRPGSLVLSHRDLHDKQVLCGTRTVGLIDWDLAALAPPGLDPGNFLAHLTLRTLQGRILPDRAAAIRKSLLEAMGLPGRPGTASGASRAAGVRDLHNWVSVALLRLVGVYVLRPGWPGLARRILAAFHESRKAA